MPKQTKTQQAIQKLAVTFAEFNSGGSSMSLEVTASYKIPPALVSEYQDMQDYDIAETITKLLVERAKQNPSNATTIALPNDPNDSAEDTLENDTMTYLVIDTNEEVRVDICETEAESVDFTEEAFEKFRQKLDDEGKSLVLSYKDGYFNATIPELGKNAISGSGDTPLDAVGDLLASIFDKDNHGR